MLVAALSDVGQLRPANEDCFWYNEKLVVVADGMGGHSGGEVASRIAVDAVRTFAFPPIGNDRFRAMEAIERAISRANDKVYRHSLTDPKLAQMGTTLTVVLVEAEQIIVGHVGDSRAYIFRDGNMRQLTYDHSVAAELVRSGGMSEHDAAFHPHRHMLTRAVGVQPIVDVDTHTVGTCSGDGILVCTDGLTNVVAESEIEAVLRADDDPSIIVEELVNRANDQGAPDNVTVVYARVR